MSLSKCTVDVDNISTLPDKPTLTAAQLKAKFDKTGSDIKTYLNSTLTDELDTELARKANTSSVMPKGNFYKTAVALSTPLIPTSGVAQLSYPTGFNKSNTIVLNAMVTNVSEEWFYPLYGINDLGIHLDTSEIFIDATAPSGVDLNGTKIELLLMKIS